MTNFMSIDQIISAAKTDISIHVAKGTWKGQEPTTNDDEENFHTITSLYVQWAKDEGEADLKLWEMYEEDYSDYFK